MLGALALVFVVELIVTHRSQLTGARTALGAARWMWLPALIVASAATYYMASLVLAAASRNRLAFKRTVAVQVAAAFTNRLAPAGLGGVATNVRYLERCGQDRAEAMSAVAITSAAGIFVHVSTVVIVGLLFLTSGPRTYRPDLRLGDHWLAMVTLVAVLVAVGLLLCRHLTSWTGGLPRSLRVSVGELLRRPHDLCRLISGSAGMTCSHTVALVICIQMFGGGVSLLSIAVVYLGAGGIASALPIPGGAGAVEAALVGGLIDVGAASRVAVAAVLMYRLATFWLPILPGVLTFRAMRRRRLL